ncbi:MAG TPA: STAS domain-containing protein [Vicinamibacterales bacterium]|nr:STAS domain-containing protein [Vicinamibacterales bacterium]
MDITLRQRDEITILDLKGTVHCGDGDRELEAVITDLTIRGCTSLVINLKDVTHVDTMCLGVIIAAQLRLQRRQGVVLLLETPPRIRHMLRIARIDEFLLTCETEADAIRALRAAGSSSRGGGAPGRLVDA